MNDKLLNRLRKVLALAERGIGGEKENAQRMLEKLMAKYDLDIEDLEGESVQCYWWNYDNRFEADLLKQVYGKVKDITQISYYKGDRKFGFDLTKAEYLDMDVHYTVLRKDLKTHIEDAYNAFIAANDVYPETSSGRIRQRTSEELERLERQLRMAEHVKRSNINRQLTKH